MTNLFIDALSMFKKNQVTLVEKIQEFGDAYTFTFKTAKKLDWKPGQHGIFIVKNNNLRNSLRPFSLSSIPKEDKVMISTKISENPSDFKKTLRDLEPGMSITMRGPIGILETVVDRPQLFIAVGIGITPYRGLLKDFKEKERKEYYETELIYLSRPDEHLYLPTWKELSEESLITVHLVTIREDLDTLIENFVTKHHKDALYFVVGPRPIVSSMKKNLKKLGIPKKNIKTEVFLGY